jgi:hypothetical protein
MPTHNPDSPYIFKVLKQAEVYMRKLIPDSIIAMATPTDNDAMLTESVSDLGRISQSMSVDDKKTYDTSMSNIITTLATSSDRLAALEKTLTEKEAALLESQAAVAKKVEQTSVNETIFASVLKQALDQSSAREAALIRMNNIKPDANGVNQLLTVCSTFLGSSREVTGSSNSQPDTTSEARKRPRRAPTGDSLLTTYMAAQKGAHLSVGTCDV